jgi:GTP1/Obg family GTP-binding protein
MDTAWKEVNDKLKLLSQCELMNCKIRKDTHDKIKRKYVQLSSKIAFKSAEYWENKTKELEQKQKKELLDTYACASNLCDEVAREYIKARIAYAQAQLGELSRELEKNANGGVESVIEHYKTDIDKLQEALQSEKLTTLQYVQLIRGFSHIK